MNRVLCTLYTAQYTLQDVNNTLYSVQYIRYTVHRTMYVEYTVQYIRKMYVCINRQYMEFIKYSHPASVRRTVRRTVSAVLYDVKCTPNIVFTIYESMRRITYDVRYAIQGTTYV